MPFRPSPFWVYFTISLRAFSRLALTVGHCAASISSNHRIKLKSCFCMTFCVMIPSALEEFHERFRWIQNFS